MKTCAIVGINWGDEGKGRMVDLVAEEYDIVVRYQGGNNAGHTIKNDYGTFALNLLPSGIFRREKMNILGNGTVVDHPPPLRRNRTAARCRRLYLPGKPYDKLPCHHCYALSCCIGRA